MISRPLPVPDDGTAVPAGRLFGALSWSCLGLAFLLLAAHALRGHGPGAALGWLAWTPLLFLRQAWARRALQLALAAGFMIWLDASADLVALRQAMGLPWLRLAAIMGAVTGLTGAAVLCLESDRFRRRFHLWPERTAPALSALALTFAGLAAVQLTSPRPLLLAERFLPGAGWPEAVLLSAYAAWQLCRLLDRRQAAAARRQAWSLFSLVFFGQLALGLLSRLGWTGFAPFLMTGRLHLPVPALILAGPLYRADGLFMLGLFLVTVLLVGPAWCGHLCYIGAWDNAMAGRPRGGRLPAWAKPVRFALAGLVLAAALAMGQWGVPVEVAGALAAGFGLVGVLVMLLASRRLGVMAHCAVFCPLGAVATLLGRLHPFRVQVGAGCTKCQACVRRCSYGALRPEDLDRGRPGLGCSLCGDCVAVCPKGDMEYRLFGRTIWGRGGWTVEARTVFLVLVVGLHALFLGLARM